MNDISREDSVATVSPSCLPFCRPSALAAPQKQAKDTLASVSFIITPGKQIAICVRGRAPGCDVRTGRGSNLGGGGSGFGSEAYTDRGELRTKTCGPQSAYAFAGTQIVASCVPTRGPHLRTNLVLQSAYQLVARFLWYRTILRSAYQLGASICVHNGGGKRGYLDLRTDGGSPERAPQSAHRRGVSSQSSMLLLYNWIVHF